MKIKITWASPLERMNAQFPNISVEDNKAYLKERANEESVSLEIEHDFPAEWEDVAVCNFIYRETNLYNGEFWDAISDVLPEGRSHTAISIGDVVSVNGKSYMVEGFGWKEVA